jgi:hypothetical protein
MDALRLEVKKDGFSQLQSGNYKLTVTLNPTDLDDNTQSLLLDFIKAPMGAIYMLGMARVDDVGEPAAKPKKRFHELPYSQQAALRCKEEQFHVFLHNTRTQAHVDARVNVDHRWADLSMIPREGMEGICINLVRRICNVGSRSLLDSQEEAGQCWQSLNAEYEQWAGLLPEKR